MEALLKAIQLRKLDRIAAAYAVSAWLLVQAGSIAQPLFNLPIWSFRAFVIFVCIGFPVTLAFAWFAAPHTIDTHSPDKRRLAMLAVVAGVLIVSAAEATYWLARVAEKPATEPVVSSPPVPLPQRASIAVLPFDNMSGDAGKVYFSDGISDEILNDLANVRELRVAARASSFSFKGKTTDIKTIARLLAVRTLLQGSVREAGERIRITAQLINASDGYVIWSSTFDRNLTDVIDVQDEIARAITTNLTNRLVPRANRPGTINPEAYRAYLQGQYYLAQGIEADSIKATPLLEKTIALQPDFAPAFVGLSKAYIDRYYYRRYDSTLLQSANAALTHALELAPNDLNALRQHIELAILLNDWTGAMADVRRMQKINPNSAITLDGAAALYTSLGFYDIALAQVRELAELDPLSIGASRSLTEVLLALNRWKEIVVAAKGTLALHPGHPVALWRLCTGYAYSGRFEDADKIDGLLATAHDTDGDLACRIDIADASGHHAEAEALMDAIAARYGKGGTGWSEALIGWEYAIIGSFAKAIVWLNRAYDNRDLGFVTMPLYKSIRPEFFKQPGWIALTQKPLFREWQAAHDMVAAQLASNGQEP
jgi:TolB-like protein